MIGGAVTCQCIIHFTKVQYLCKMPYSILERIALIEAYIHFQSFEDSRRVFVEKFLNTSIPAKRGIKELVKKNGIQQVRLQMQNGIENLPL